MGAGRTDEAEPSEERARGAPGGQRARRTRKGPAGNGQLSNTAPILLAKWHAVERCQRGVACLAVAVVAQAGVKTLPGGDPGGPAEGPPPPPLFLARFPQEWHKSLGTCQESWQEREKGSVGGSHMGAAEHSDAHFMPGFCLVVATRTRSDARGDS